TVAHQVGERIDDALDEALVELGGGALGDQPDLLAHLGGGLTHHAREPAEHVIHRHHADGHHRFLEIASVAVELFDAVEQAVVEDGIERGSRLYEHGLGDDQFAHQIDDLVDLLDADANGAAARRTAAAR